MTTAPTTEREDRARLLPVDLPPPGVPPRPALRWWREVALVAAFYAVYTAIRDLHGTRPVSVASAYANALRVIHLEQAVGVFHELDVQRWVLHDRFVVQTLDVWYGSTHFVVTGAVLLALFLRRPPSYRRWRNTLAGATALALVGFAFFPLMPPRLLPTAYGFTDTLQAVGGLWDFNSGPMTHLSDQFAAMPSLHFAWALWCGLAMAVTVRHRWAKVLAAAYPAITLLCVIATANHFFTDTAIGALTVGAGYGAARAAEAIAARRRPAPLSLRDDERPVGSAA